MLQIERSPLRGISGLVGGRSEDPYHTWTYAVPSRQVMTASDLCIAAEMPGVWGSKVRLERCNADDAAQKFDYYASGQLSSEADERRKTTYIQHVPTNGVCS